MTNSTLTRSLSLAAFAITAGMMFSASAQASTSTSMNSCIGSSRLKVVKCCEQHVEISPNWRNIAQPSGCNKLVVCVGYGGQEVGAAKIKRCYIKKIVLNRGDGEPTPDPKDQPDRRTGGRRK